MAADKRWTNCRACYEGWNAAARSGELPPAAAAPLAAHEGFVATCLHSTVIGCICLLACTMRVAITLLVGLLVAPPAWAQTTPRVAIVGGGVGGASAAFHVRQALREAEITV